MTDSQLRDAVVKRLDWATGVRSEHIGVGVTDGVVTLTGEVLSPAERAAAVAAAVRVQDVEALADEIVVHCGAPGDADIARQVQGYLLRVRAESPKDVLHNFRLSATVHDGCVELGGSVPHESLRAELVAQIAAVPGVRQVHGVLEVCSELTPADVDAEIDAALGANRERVVRSTVCGASVSLAGTVLSWAERHQAETVAAAIPGVRHVDNRLVVRNHPRPFATEIGTS